MLIKKMTDKEAKEINQKNDSNKNNNIHQTVSLISNTLNSN